MHQLQTATGVTSPTHQPLTSCCLSNQADNHTHTHKKSAKTQLITFIPTPPHKKGGHHRARYHTTGTTINTPTNNNITPSTGIAPKTTSTNTLATASKTQAAHPNINHHHTTMATGQHLMDINTKQRFWFITLLSSQTTFAHNNHPTHNAEQLAATESQCNLDPNKKQNPGEHHNPTP